MRKPVFIFLLFFIKLEAQQISSSNELSLYFDQPEVLSKAGIKGVRCIFKDSRQLIWIGTGNGLYRYDGTNVIYQRHKPGDTSSIPNNVIVNITEDKKGNIWIGTMGGVGCINPYNLKCKVYRDELHNLTGNFDNKVLTGDAGEIWTGNSEGFFLLDTKKDCFQKVWRNTSAGKPSSGYVTCISYWTKDTIVIGTFNDLVLMNTKDYGFKRILPLGKNILVTHLLIDTDHRLWIGTWAEGCLIANPFLSDFQQYKWEKAKRSGIANVVSSITETTSSIGKTVWISGGSLLIKLPLPKNSSVINSKKAEFYTTSLIKNNNDPGSISFLMADNENYLWTGGATIAKFKADKNLFRLFPIKLEGSVQNIQAINTRNQKFLVISMWHGSEGMLSINQETGKFRVVKTVAQQDPFGANMSGVAVDKHNRIWLSSLGGVYLLNNKFQFANNLTETFKQSGDSLSGKKTNEILISNDTVWIACYKKGIDLYDLNFHKLKHFVDHDGTGMRDNLFERFFKDGHGNIWICGNSFFYKYLPQTATFRSYDLSIEHAAYSPTDVAELPDGNLMIATESGLIYFDVRTEAFRKITSPLTEKEETILSVTVDGNGDVWYLTESHLVRYQMKTKKFTLFGEEDGLDVNNLQFIRSFDGRQILLAEREKLLQFNPANWEKDIDPPGLFVHTIQINDSTLQSPSPLTDLKLNYDQNKIYIEFDGITYTKPEQNQYMYFLKGLDKDWIISTKNFASYSNLSPGNYIFHVKAANYEGVWSKEYLLNITITPPFWKTWWFLGLSALAIGAIFFLIVRYIAQRNLRERILKLEKEQAVEKERNRIARDMHDDLGSGLTKIAILSEVAKTQLHKHEEAEVQLEKISFSSRELVDSLQDIIWVLNPKNDSLDNLAAYIREYTLKFFDGTEIIVHFQYPSSIPAIKLSEEQRRNIFMVVKETLNNIARHSCNNTVLILLHVYKHQLQIAITDDGKGFDLSQIRNFANGLSNMKMRMEQLKGSYEINSAVGKGTTTRLTVPF